MSFFGAKLKVSLVNQVSVRVGLFDGYFRVDINNEALAAVALLGITLPIIDGQAAFVLAAQVRLPLISHISGKTFDVALLNYNDRK